MIKKRKPTEKDRIKWENNRIEIERMKLFFSLIWAGMKKRECWSCGEPIYGECKPLYFDHLLEKSSYDEIKYELWNIFFCCGACHKLKNDGYPTAKHKEAIKKAKEQYEKFRAEKNRN